MPQIFYREWLKQDFDELIEKLRFHGLQKRFMFSSWLDQSFRMENRACSARKWHHTVRVIIIIAGIIIFGGCQHMSMEKPFRLTFSNGLRADAIRVNNSSELPSALRELGIRYPRPALVLVGGAGGMSEADLTKLRSLFVESLVPVIQTLGAAVVDGGTDAGVMRLMGEARAVTSAMFPLIGVSAAGTVVLPNTATSNPDAAPLEPHHTHFVLVPGDQWGDESPWLSDTAGALADGKPSVTVLVNGGAIAWKDVSESVKARRFVVVVAGSGRTANKLTAALRGEPTDERARDLIASGLVQAINPAEGFDRFRKVIEGILSTKR